MSEPEWSSSERALLIAERERALGAGHLDWAWWIDGLHSRFIRFVIGLPESEENGGAVA